MNNHYQQFELGFFCCFGVFFFKAQEELAWKIAKMIVSDVMQQAQYDQPLEKSTKVRMTCSDLACIKLERI